MIITWQGHSCFKIQDKTTTDGLTLVTDPYDKSLGLKVPNFEADIVTVSHDHSDHNNISTLRGNPFVINCAGEYDIKGVMVEGIDSFHDEKKGEERGRNIIYRIEMDDIVIVHLGDLGHVLDSSQLDYLNKVDVLMIPVGGKYTLDAHKAVEVIAQLEPRIIIPMHYKAAEVKLDLESLDKFIKEVGLQPRYEEKLKLTKKDLPVEDMELVILEINN
ncbi:MAG: MBL fold metallo-hydrolase [Planctomycetes bacterium]|jgi:L-ascorbate metabolism protein UlaG (beta-lactamase superfamily)|nr:MBL fold metallo-hydrolase [Planctomycetota bacterium]